MTLQIPLSLSGPADAFAAAVEAHRAALEAHRVGVPGVPAPMHSSSLVETLVERVPRGDPLPDEFVVRPYVIVDDSPTLDERKAVLNHQLQIAGVVARDAVVSPARLRLLDLDMAEALSVPEERRTPAQVAAVAAYVAVGARHTEIARNAALAAVEIEDLPSIEAVEAWKVPPL